MLEKIKSFFYSLLMLVFFVFALSITILVLNYNEYGLTQFDDTTLVVITGSMTSDTYKKGDLVLLKTKKIKELEKGEDVFTYRLDGKGGVSVEVGKLGEIYLEEDAIAFENGDTFAMEFVAGTPYEIHNNIGTFLGIVESKWGFLFLILVPCFLIFVYEIYALIVEIKYGEEE